MEIDNQPEIVTIWNEAKGCVERGDCDKAIEIYKYILVRYGDDRTVQEYANAYLGDVYLLSTANEIVPFSANKMSHLHTKN